MRVLITVLALVTAPFLASVSQEPAGNPPCWTVEHGTARDSHSQGQGNHWAKGHAKHACAPPVGDGGGGGGGTGGDPGGGGLGEIDGTSYLDVNRDGFQEAGEPGLAGWTIALNLVNPDGTVTLQTTTLTDAAGNYAFPALSAGTYLVCETVQDLLQGAGYHLTEPATPRPACAGGFGNTVSVPVFLVPTQLPGWNFGNAPT